MNARDKELVVWSEILRSYQGRWIVSSILESCRWKSPPCTHPQETFRDLGRQDVAGFIVDMINAADRKALAMIELEALDRIDSDNKNMEDKFL